MAFDWTTNRLANTPWRIQIVSDIVPILIRRAKEGRNITYGDLAQELQDEFGHEQQPRKTKYGPPVGAVGQVIEALGRTWGERIPPINTIVVDARTDLPSTGADEIAHYFFEDNGRGMEKDREAYMRAAQKAVFAYKGWDRVAEALGSDGLELKTGAIDQGEKIDLPKLPKVYGVESAKHKALKKWVVSNPSKLIEFGRFKTTQGQIERLLSSGDRLDAYFDNGRQRLAVEVKASNCDDSELMRGVYQCIKYRAVLQAEQQALRIAPNGDAVLVSTQQPGKKVRALMKRLLVSFVLAPIGAEK